MTFRMATSSSFIAAPPICRVKIGIVCEPRQTGISHVGYSKAAGVMDWGFEGGSMRALVKAEKAEGLVMRDEPVPVPGPDDILIKVAKTGICGTDLHIWKWDEWAQKTIPVPMVVGHEFAG